MPASSNDGRINLEQQRKRAKDLLRQLKAETNPSTPPTLAHAQWLTARELGFSSWPKLKAHVDAIDFAARHPGFEASDEANTGHWRCGNDIAHSLQLAGFRGAFHMLADPLCMGPVQDVAPQPYRALRSAFISQTFDVPLADALQRTQDEYNALAQLAGPGHNVLWCEADAYDQLFLIRALAGLPKVPERLELIEVRQVPGVQRFIGIGQLAPDLLAWLWPQRRPVDAAMLALARQAWQSYCAPSPLALADLAREDHLALPLLAPALRRQLQELPGIADGLSLTERLGLRYIHEVGEVTIGQVFAELMSRREPLPYLGDLMFHALLRPLIDARQPLLVEDSPQLPWPHRPVRLTALGERVLASQAYWPDHSDRERWVGGVAIRPGQAHWAIDAQGAPLWRPAPPQPL
ncbi:DUF1835 domain-containing protein [Pseudomonas eucalypticola]|uniref:DUF1835 domain-containing protein n=1 Tax=Pseudomonas eucalypticola TaxID=2599595 RepID=A0A7D5HXA8_9PSED|nr:DUF1835 domain-containing protein [Pseudomonas eucalypticola]QKZ04811.1 DUF1835 domain-containing protein [Pseudomonas eucalypticola]